MWLVVQRVTVVDRPYQKALEEELDAEGNVVVEARDAVPAETHVEAGKCYVERDIEVVENMIASGVEVDFYTIEFGKGVKPKLTPYKGG